jgi:toluene monooxygenase system protein A
VALMARDEWLGFVDDVDWTFSYVDDGEVHPDWLTGTGKVPRRAWEAWDVGYKVSYPDYVATQRDKEAGVYAVKAALGRTEAFPQLAEGWKTIAKAHFGAVALVEYMGMLGELRMARFGLSPAWRNTATLGALDEIRHTQLQLSVAHQLLARDPQFDWAQKAFHTNDWVVVAARAMLDGMIAGANVVDLALQLPFTLETGFTNLQFVALAADALDSGDVNFFATITGPAMDYYTPLEHRKQSYREFMEEWIVGQFMRSLTDYGLRKPWYWDEFLAGLDVWHHSLHLGTWFWRPTLWWRPPAGVSRAERAWLSDRYPRWEELYGPLWDVIIDNVNAERMEATFPETLPWLCNTCHLPITTWAQSPYDGRWQVRTYPLEHGGSTYHFCSKPCRQIWWEDKDTLHQRTVIERLLGGEIDPPTVEGILGWMGLTPETMGDDAYGYRWAKEYATSSNGGGNLVF